jgi:hypothetical protein
MQRCSGTHGDYAQRRTAMESCRLVRDVAALARIVGVAVGFCIWRVVRRYDIRTIGGVVVIEEEDVCFWQPQREARRASHLHNQGNPHYSVRWLALWVPRPSLRFKFGLCMNFPSTFGRGKDAMRASCSSSLPVSSYTSPNLYTHVLRTSFSAKRQPTSARSIVSDAVIDCLFACLE